MQRSKDGGLLRSVIVACLLVLAFAMLAMAVSATTQPDWPQIVRDKFKAVIGNI